MEINYEVRHAVRVLAIRDDKILCIRYKGKNEGYYDFPGGKIEQGETEIQACIREVKEETGVDVNKLSYVGSFNIFYPEIKKQFDMKVFMAEEVMLEPQCFLENDSFWMKIDELKKKDKRLAITHLIDDDKFRLIKEGNFNISCICDDNHNIIEIEER